MTNFKEYFIDGKKNILIPALQRDYVQGSRTDIIKPFIEELLSALKDEYKNIDLNYIYGDIEDESFVPVDGQQRLITLWLLHLYIYNKQKQNTRFSVELKFNSREFADSFSKKLSEEIGSIINSVSLREEIINSPWFVSGWLNDKSVCNMLNTLELMHESFNKKDQYIYFENISFAFLELNTNSLSDDIYVKMNGRGRPLSYFENLKSWMDKKVTELFGDGDEFVEEWQQSMDNEWTDFFWQNRNKTPNHQEDIDDEQERFFYNLLRIFWIKKNKRGFIPNKEKRELVCRVLNFENDNKLEENIISKISNSNNFMLPLYVIDNLNLFTKEFFEWLRNIFNGLYLRYKEINSEKIEFDFDNNSTTLIYKIFFSSENRQLIISSSILDFITYCCNTNLHDWIRFTRNILCNITNISDTDNSLTKYLLSFEKIAKKCSGMDSCLPFLIKNNESYNGIANELMAEEKIKAQLIYTNRKRWQKRIENLENNKYFTGQIKFIFDFLSDEPVEEIFDKYSKIMLQLFSGNGKNGNYFSANIKETVFSRALLCFTTSYSYGYQVNSNWSFLKSSKTDKNTWKRFVKDSEKVYESVSHNDCLKKLLDTLIKNYNGNVTEENLNDIIQKNKENINDWRKFFIDYPDVWLYMNEADKYIRWGGNEFDIGLVKRIQYGDNVHHAELRSYCLYLDYLQSKKNIKWDFGFHEFDKTCLYFQKEINDFIIAMDVFFDVKRKSEDSYKLELFLRPKDNESDKVTKSRSQNYLRPYVEKYLVESGRGFITKNNYSKEKIQEIIKNIINTDFK